MSWTCSLVELFAFAHRKMKMMKILEASIWLTLQMAHWYFVLIILQAHVPHCRILQVKIRVGEHMGKTGVILWSGHGWINIKVGNDEVSVSHLSRAG